MTGLDRRIQKADKLTQQADCKRCGGPPLPGEATVYDVTWDDGEIWEEDDPAEDEETFCECGRQTGYVIKWDDHDETPPHVVAWIQEQREKARARELLDGLEFDEGEGER